MIIDRINPRVLIWVGVTMLILGFILPLLMVAQVLKSTFFLNFFSWGCSFAGLLLGTLGVVTYARNKRRRQ
jgi:hypothetical protein